MQQAPRSRWPRSAVLPRATPRRFRSGRPLNYDGKIVTSSPHQGKSVISSLQPQSDIGGELDRGQLTALVQWNTANRKLRSSDRAPPAALPVFLHYQYGRWVHRLMRLAPRCRAILAVLWRPLGMEASETLFG